MTQMGTDNTARRKPEWMRRFSVVRDVKPVPHWLTTYPPVDAEPRRSPLEWASDALLVLVVCTVLVVLIGFEWVRAHSTRPLALLRAIPRRLGIGKAQP